MRNLKLKKVRPVATETETLHKNGDDLGLHLVGDSSQESPLGGMRSVKTRRVYTSWVIFMT